MTELHDEALERTTLSALANVGTLDVSEARGLLEAHPLEAADFAVRLHAEAHEAMRRLARQGQPFSLHGLHHELLASSAYAEAGGEPWLCALLVASGEFGAAYAGHVRVLKGLATRRQVLETARRIATEARDFSLEADELPSNAARLYANLRAGGIKLQTLDVDLHEFHEEVHETAEGKREVCIKTGIQYWDKLLGGLLPAIVTFIGAQPGVGKSALLARMIINFAQRGIRVGFFSLEDRPKWLCQRAVSAQSRIPVHVLATQKLSERDLHRFDAAVGEVYPWHRDVVRCPPSSMTPSRMSQMARRMVLDEGCRVLFLDHLGELDVRTHQRQGRHDLDVNEGIKAIRDVAVDCNLPFVVAAHFSRPPRGEKEARYVRPTSTSWGESSFVEKKARAAVGLFQKQGVRDRIYANVLKQQLGQADIDFWMPFDPVSGLVLNEGGGVERDTAGEEKRGHDADAERQERLYAVRGDA